MEAQPLQASAPTLLIVDDEPLITDLFKQYMTRRGYNVLTAQSGAAALDIAKAESEILRLVISDLTMPGMTGLEFAAALLLAAPRLPVLIATGHALDAAENSLPSNVVGIAQKPYQNRLLADQIKQFLEHPDQPFPE